MELLGSLTSPFVRQARVVIAEKQLSKRIPLVETNPFENPPELLAANPLGKVPALTGSEAGTLHDSRLICEYIDSLNDTPRLLPASGAERWTALRRQATAAGLMDTAAAHTMESRRADGIISPQWQERRNAAMRRAVAAIADDLHATTPPLDMGTIATACALAYLDFRHPQITWRQDHPELATWLDSFAQRESMLSTRPPA